MPIQNPEDVLDLVAQAINSGDVDAQIALYEPEACFHFEPGQAASSGIQAIREAISGFLAMQPKLTLEAISLNQTRDITLIRNSWHLTATEPDGNPVNMRGQTAVVLRRQPEGNWLIVIDNPYSLS
jgi:uncharacterized protein (TIGR02246 family)